MKKNVKISSVIFTVIKYLSLIVASLIAIAPVCVCVLTAFKSNEEYAASSVLDLPKSFGYLENFKIAVEKANMLRGFLNTAVVLVVVLFASIMVSLMLAYVLNRFKFPGRGMIENLFLFASLLPGIAMQVTIYQIMYSLGLINHLYGYMIVLMGTDIISIYIFLQFFENLSTSLDESAIMDGWMYLLWGILQDSVPAFKAGDRYDNGIKRSQCVQRILRIQPVLTASGVEDNFHSTLYIYRSLRKSV